jgi:DDE family transposase
VSHRRPVVLKRDHARPRTPPAPSTAAFDAHLTELIQPAILAQDEAYRRLGLRERVLALPAMVAIVLTIVWRQVPAVSEAARLLAKEGVLWTPALRVSQQALSLRLRSLPESLFAGLWAALAPTLQARAAARTRPLPPVVARLQRHYPRTWALDGSTLEELFKKVGLLRPEPTTVLGGTLEAVLDLATKLPVQLWLERDPVGNDLRFLDRVKALLPPGTLLVLDAAYWAFPFFDWLTEHGCGFVIRARTVRAETVVRVLHESAHVRDRIVKLGLYRSNPCAHPVRVVEVRIGTTWRPYLTNVLDPAVLSVADVVDLYGRRWRIEEAFLVTKRLLGLSYLWSGAYNGIALQVWSTWLLYAVLVDLSDAIAAELGQPLDAMSLEMTYRGLYHFTSAFHRGEATDPVAYLAAQDDLGLVKRRRKHRDRRRATLDTWREELNL